MPYRLPWESARPSGAVGGDFHRSAAGLMQVVEIEVGLAGVVELDAGARGCAAGEVDAAQTEDAVVGFEARGGKDLPAGAGEPHAAVLIPGPGLGEQDEAVAGIAETRLQHGADIAGDEVGGSGRIAVVDDARDGAGLAAFGAAEGRIEVVEAAVGIGQQRRRAPASADGRQAAAVSSTWRLSGLSGVRSGVNSASAVSSARRGPLIAGATPRQQSEQRPSVTMVRAVGGGKAHHQNLE